MSKESTTPDLVQRWREWFEAGNRRDFDGRDGGLRSRLRLRSCRSRRWLRYRRCLRRRKSRSWFNEIRKEFRCEHRPTPQEGDRDQYRDKNSFFHLRDGVPTSRIEHVTPRQPPHAQPHTAPDAVFFDRLRHVHRARRFEAAHRRQERRDEPLVNAKYRDCKRLHASEIFRSARSRSLL